MKSFLADRPRVSSPAVRHSSFAPSSPFTALSSATQSSSAPARPIPARHSQHADSPAQVECVRDGDTITRLIITCACGERTEIDCLYPPR